MVGGVGRVGEGGRRRRRQKEEEYDFVLEENMKEVGIDWTNAGRLTGDKEVWRKIVREKVDLA